MGVGELAVAVLGAGFGKPGAEPDRVAVDDDLLPGTKGAAFAVEGEFQGASKPRRLGRGRGSEV